MKAVLNSVLAVVVGLVIGGIVIAGIETLSHLLYPPPAGLDFSDRASVEAFAAALPFGAFASVLFAWLAGTFCGAWLAARIAQRKPLVHSLVVGVFFLSGGIFSMISIPHPAWMWLGALIVFPAGAWAGARLARPVETAL